MHSKCLQVAREANTELLELPPEWEATDPAALLAAVANELHSTQEATRLSALLWLNTLLSRSRPTVRPCPRLLHLARRLCRIACMGVSVQKQRPSEIRSLFSKRSGRSAMARD